MVLSLPLIVQKLVGNDSFFDFTKLFSENAGRWWLQTLQNINDLVKNLMVPVLTGDNFSC